jgi:FeS assembly ATPase SufC
LELDPHERAAAGLFLGFQYPVEIPGVSNVQFLRESLNAQRRARGEGPLSGAEFLKLARAQAAALGMDAEMLKRPVNVGFSGGEKKRNEMVQMGIIDPSFAILDETDSGLDIDALRIVGDGINRIMRGTHKAVLLITHYQRLLDYVKPDIVHVLGRAGARTRARARGLWRGGGVMRVQQSSPARGGGARSATEGCHPLRMAGHPSVRPSACHLPLQGRIA